METKSNQDREEAECPTCVGAGVQQSDSDGPPTFGVEPCTVCGGTREVKPGTDPALHSDEIIYEFRLIALNKYRAALVTHSSFPELDDPALLLALASFWRLWTKKAVGMGLTVTRITATERTPLPAQPYVQLIAEAAETAL